jgi:hypothetical protein
LDQSFLSSLTELISIYIKRGPTTGTKKRLEKLI